MQQDAVRHVGQISLTCWASASALGHTQLTKAGPNIRLGDLGGFWGRKTESRLKADWNRKNQMISDVWAQISKLWSATRSYKQKKVLVPYGTRHAACHSLAPFLFCMQTNTRLFYRFLRNYEQRASNYKLCKARPLANLLHPASQVGQARAFPARLEKNTRSRDVQLVETFTGFLGFMVFHCCFSFVSFLKASLC